MSDTSEHEMIERLIDGARTAARRVQDMCRSVRFGMPIPPLVLIRFRHALRAASGSAHQLGHAQSNATFFAIHDQLDQFGTHLTAATLVGGERAGFALATIGAALDRLWRAAEQVASSKAMPRQDVLAALDERQKALVH